MDKKKILIVSNSFYPQNTPRSFRTTELAKEFARQGHLVTVLVPFHPEQIKIAQGYGIIIKDLGHLDDSKILDYKNKKLNILQKALNRFRVQYLLYPQLDLKELVFNALEKEKHQNYDLLISIAAPHAVHWGVSKELKKNRNITTCWVADCGDPFMLAQNLHFNRPFYFKYLEKDFCKVADFITIPTKEAFEGYYPEFRHKLKVIPQGFKFEDISINPNPSHGGMLKLGYAGTLIKGRRDPTELLNYLEKNGTSYQFVVYSKNKAFAEELSIKFPGKIDFRGEADRNELLFHLSGLDFVLNFENVGVNQTPSKLIDYAIINKPILSIHVGNLNTQIVDEFVNRNYQSQYIIRDLDQFRIENVAVKFLKLLEEHGAK